MEVEISQAQQVESLFIQEDGYLFMSKLFWSRNNTIDINLAECANKEDFSFEEVKNPQGLESDSPHGKIA